MVAVYLVSVRHRGSGLPTNGSANRQPQRRINSGTKTAGGVPLGGESSRSKGRRGSARCSARPDPSGILNGQAGSDPVGAHAAFVEADPVGVNEIVELITVCRKAQAEDRKGTEQGKQLLCSAGKLTSGSLTAPQPALRWASSSCGFPGGCGHAG